MLGEDASPGLSGEGVRVGEREVQGPESAEKMVEESNKGGTSGLYHREYVMPAFLGPYQR